MAGFILPEKLKYYSRNLNNEGVLNILLVSTSQFHLEKLSKSIYATRDVQRDKRSYNLQIHTCKSILDVIQLTSNEFFADFVIFILDTRVSCCLAEVENNLKFLDSSLTREKICLLNVDFSYEKSVISPNEIWEFAQFYQFNLINGNTEDQDSLFNCSKRILNLAEASCGILSGIPMINLV